MDTVAVLRELTQKMQQLKTAHAAVTAHAMRERHPGEQIQAAADMSSETVRQIARDYDVPARRGPITGLSSRSPGVRTIARAIADRIAAGQLRPGDPAPTSQEIRAEHQVTGKTAHAVLEALARAEIISDPKQEPVVVLDPDRTTLPTELIDQIGSLGTEFTALHARL